MLDQPVRGRGWQAAQAVTTDERLAALAAKADRAAFELLWERHHRGLLALCRQMLGRREDAEDAVQQTFLSAYQALERGAVPRRFRAWLYAAARNQCLALLDARPDEVVADVEIEDSETLPAIAERRHDVRQLLADMQRLPRDQRAALALSTLRPLTHEEIARVLGRSRNEVKSLVFQARASLAASRSSREVPCEAIRGELVRSPRAALRRLAVRRHLRDCPGCRVFRQQLRRQSDLGALILLLPPSIELKERAMELVFGASLAGGVAGAGVGVAAIGNKATALLGAAAVLGAAGGLAAHYGLHPSAGVPEARLSPTATSKAAAAPTAAAGPQATIAARPAAASHAVARAAKGARQREREHRARAARHRGGAPGGGAETPAGGAAPGSSPSPAALQPPAVPAVPQAPAVGLPSAPASPETATQVRPPVAAPAPPPAGVQAPQLPAPPQLP